MSPLTSRSPGARHRRAVSLLLPAAVVLAGTLLSAPGASAATSCPDADAQPRTVGAARSAAALGCLVNHEREAAGLQPLAIDTRAQQAAQGHADDMAARNYFSHDAPAPAPNGTTVGDRLTAASYPWVLNGENIGRGQPTPRIVMAAWLASSGHCTNLMSAEFTNLGIGVSAASGGPYWVQTFARPAGVPVPAGPSAACTRTPAIPAPDGTPLPGGGTGTSTGGGQTGTSAGSGSSSGSGSGATGTGTPTPPGTAATPAAATAATTRLRASAKRTRRRLMVRVTLPAGTGRPTVVIRVVQRGRTVRTLRVRLSRGRLHRLGVSLPAARAGRITVRASGRTASVRFR